MDAPDRARRPAPGDATVGNLVRTYEALGHTVEFVDPVLGLPDMVFAANAAS